MHHSYSHTIHILQRRNQTAMVTAVAILIASLMVTAMLPTFLLRYVYVDQQLFAQPPLLEYIPVVSFVVGIGFFLVAIIGNIIRAQRINHLMSEMDVTNDGDCCGSCDGQCGHHHDHHEKRVMGSVDSLAEALVKESKSNQKMVKKFSPKKAKK